MSKVNALLKSRYVGVISGILIGSLITWFFFMPSAEHQHSEEKGTVAGASEPAKATLWTCSMHPQIKMKEPGNCPKCGMKLIPLLETSANESPREMSMSEASLKLAEIQTAPAHRDFEEHELRMVGKVVYDETRLKYSTAWFPGRLDRLFVDYTGTPVKKGDHLVEIYSPSILTDQEALLQALQASETLGQSTISQVRTSRLEVLERARERLRLLGLTDSQIQDIETTKIPTDRITFFSPIDGIVIHKNALEGDYVQTGTRIYTIADLSQVWVKMDAYESDLQWIHYSQEVEFTTVSYPGRVFKGRISFIDPFLNEKTRTVKVRVNVDNRDGRLKPDMFVRAIVRAKVNSKGKVYDTQLSGKWIGPMHPEIIKDGPGKCDICGMPLVKAEELGFADTSQKDVQPPLLIPDTAPLITGTRAVVYVKVPGKEMPTFEGREVVLGPRLQHSYVVFAGLEEGEEVVVKGNFKIDSALQIHAKPSMMSPKGGGGGGGHHHGSMKKDAPQMKKKMPAMPNVVSAEVASDFFPSYRAITIALNQDHLGDAQKASQDWVAAAQKHQRKDIEMIGHQIMHTSNINEAREAFKEMSNRLIASLEMYGSASGTAYIVFCPMAFENKGAQWIQWDQQVKNPYFGQAMSSCGEIKKTFAPSGSEKK